MISNPDFLKSCESDFSIFQKYILSANQPLESLILDIVDIRREATSPEFQLRLSRYLVVLETALDFLRNKKKYFTSDSVWEEVVNLAEPGLGIVNRILIDEGAVEVNLKYRDYFYNNHYSGDGLEEIVLRSDSREVFHVKCKSIRFSHNGGGAVPVFSNDGVAYSCLKEFYDYNNPMAYSLESLFLKRLPSNKRKSCIYIGVNGGSNYFFSLNNVLSLIGSGVDIGSCYFCFLDNVEIIYRDLLTLLGVQSSKILTANQSLDYEFDELFYIKPSYFHNIRFVDNVRLFFSNCMKSNGPKNIYISRRDSKLRPLNNEHIIEDFLIRKNFHIVTLSELKIQEQIQIFLGAENIIGIHGAGFSNIIFCNPGVNIIEIFPPNYFNPSFFQRAINAGHNYAAYVESMRGQSNFFSEFSPWNIDAESLFNFLCNKINP